MKKKVPTFEEGAFLGLLVMQEARGALNSWVRPKANNEVEREAFLQEVRRRFETRNRYYPELQNQELIDAAFEVLDQLIQKERF